MTNKHTPTPWLLSCKGNEIISNNVKGFDLTRIARTNISGIAEEDKTNAQHIVNCVNNHEALVKENKELKALVGEMVKSTETIEWCLKDAEKAIKAYEYFGQDSLSMEEMSGYVSFPTIGEYRKIVKTVQKAKQIQGE